MDIISTFLFKSGMTYFEWNITIEITLNIKKPNPTIESY